MKIQKKHKIYIGVAVALIVAYLIYRAWKAKKENVPAVQPSNFNTQAPTQTVVNNTPVTIDNNTILKRGSENDRVQWVQYYFNKYVKDKKGMARLDEDGVFGEKTEKAVKATLGKTSTTWTEYKDFVDNNFKNN
ncbi:MAG: hypothetical protein M9916_00840 [Crocinitomicaceae bacterium]|nr:hypothetical protein [Crocinitomicaceae bacterium]